MPGIGRGNIGARRNGGSPCQEVFCLSLVHQRPDGSFPMADRSSHMDTSRTAFYFSFSPSNGAGRSVT